MEALRERGSLVGGMNYRTVKGHESHGLGEMAGLAWAVDDAACVEFAARFAASFVALLKFMHGVQRGQLV